MTGSFCGSDSRSAASGFLCPLGILGVNRCGRIIISHSCLPGRTLPFVEYKKPTPGWRRRCLTFLFVRVSILRIQKLQPLREPIGGVRLAATNKIVGLRRDVYRPLRDLFQSFHCCCAAMCRSKPSVWNDTPLTWPNLEGQFIRRAQNPSDLCRYFHSGLYRLPRTQYTFDCMRPQRSHEPQSSLLRA